MWLSVARVLGGRGFMGAIFGVKGHGHWPWDRQSSNWLFSARKTLRKRSPLALTRFWLPFFISLLLGLFSGLFFIFFFFISVHLEHFLAMLKYGLRRLEYVFYIYVYLYIYMSIYSFTYRINVTGTIVQN